MRAGPQDRMISWSGNYNKGEVSLVGFLFFACVFVSVTGWCEATPPKMATIRRCTVEDLNSMQVCFGHTRGWAALPYITAPAITKESEREREREREREESGRSAAPSPPAALHFTPLIRCSGDHPQLHTDLAAASWLRVHACFSGSGTGAPGRHLPLWRLGYHLAEHCADRPSHIS